ncbi:hypothetical protein [Actinocorallia sp. A-T 12471]|uniref:hypothetical protein n=1 Tax=Actinocorallia sp. A-T 12471 TaxID=3089813 RepID=UPI0029D3AD27|nr:hypothetical protein [Actinocorallia sp. A-T 12471]MDX6743624.1 hypothetical protein [Actinocorallia sp. A-T 12471]
MTVPRRILRPWHKFDASLRRALPTATLDLALRRTTANLTSTPWQDPPPNDPAEALLLEAVDALCTTRMIPPLLWTALLPHYTPTQLTALCLAVGDRATTTMLTTTTNFP